MSYSIFDFAGNAGVILIITAYLLLQTNKIKSNDIKYSLLNFFGATLVIVSLTESFNISAFIIELFWVGISLIGIVKFLKEKN